MDFVHKITNYHSAGYSSIFVLTHEEKRVIKDIVTMAKGKKDVNVHEWDCQNGLRVLHGKDFKHPQDKTTVSSSLLEYLQRFDQENNIFILKDFHLHFDKVLNIRLLRNAWNELKKRANTIVFVGHKFTIPSELSKEIQLLDYSLPDEASIAERLEFIRSSVNRELLAKKMPEIVISPEVQESAIEAAKGMTFHETENAFALGYTENKKFDEGFVASVFGEKIAQLKKGGLLTYLEPDIGFEDVGGLEGLKTYLKKRKRAFGNAAKEYKLPLPKGILLCGVPGVAKSMIAKATAREFDCPLFQLDIGALFDSHVGSSEANVREAIETIDAIGRCVIFIDEIEKSLNVDAVSGRGDTGVSSRVFSNLLTWMNDRKTSAYIIATSNDHTILPPALTRKGRFDMLVWLDLPGDADRKAIWQKVITKYGRDHENFAIPQLVKQTENYTGAEIEEVFKDSLYNSFNENREVKDKDLQDCLDGFVCFAESHEDALLEMRAKAKDKLVSFDVKSDKPDVKTALRKIGVDTK